MLAVACMKLGAAYAAGNHIAWCLLQGGFPNHLTALRKLRELELTSVGPGAFISLPESISNWVELRDLQLYRCGFEKVPENISALSKLDTLLMEGFR